MKLGILDQKFQNLVWKVVQNTQRITQSVTIGGSAVVVTHHWFIGDFEVAYSFDSYGAATIVGGDMFTRNRWIANRSAYGREIVFTNIEEDDFIKFCNSMNG